MLTKKSRTHSIQPPPPPFPIRDKGYKSKGSSLLLERLSYLTNISFFDTIIFLKIRKKIQRCFVQKSADNQNEGS